MDELPAKLTNMLKKANTKRSGNNHHFFCCLIIKNNSSNNSLFELILDFFGFGIFVCFFSSLMLFCRSFFV